MRQRTIIRNDKEADTFAEHVDSRNGEGAIVVGKQTMIRLSGILGPRGFRITTKDYYDINRLPENRSNAQKTDIYTVNSVGEKTIELTHRVAFMTEHALLVPYTQNGKSFGFVMAGDDRIYHAGLPKDYEKDNPKPNFAGILTDRKAKRWEEWLTKRAQDHDTEMAKRRERADKFIEKLRSTFPHAKTYDPQQRETYASVTKGNLALEYMFRDETVTAEIRVLRQGETPEDTVNLFNKMADNACEREQEREKQ